jgi:DNA repair protein RadC
MHMVTLTRFNPAVALGFMAHNLRRARHEMLVIAHLDREGEVIWRQVAISRERDSVRFPLRDIVGKLIELDTDTLILAHNHPSGIAEPSRSDIRQTRLLERVTDALNVRIGDHLIIAGERSFSFRENGLV